MDYDEKSIDSELNTFLSEADRSKQEIEELGELIDTQDNINYRDLLKLATESGIQLPDVFGAEPSLGDPEHARFTDFTRYLLYGEDVTPRDKTLSSAFSNLVYARGMVMGSFFNEPEAVETRNSALGKVLASDDYDIVEKDTFIQITNNYLSGYVDQFVLPNAIRDEIAPDVKTQLGEKVLAHEAAKRRNEKIASEVLQETELTLRSLIGEHDDLKDFSRGINLVAKCLVPSENSHITDIDEVKALIAILPIWNPDKYVESTGMNRGVMQEMILLVVGELKERGYTANL